MEGTKPARFQERLTHWLNFLALLLTLLLIVGAVSFAYAWKNTGQCLVYGIKNRWPLMMKFCLWLQPDLVNAQHDSAPDTYFGIVMSTWDKDLLRIFLERKNLSEDNVDFLFMEACFQNKLEVVKILSKYQFDFNKNESGVIWACQGRYVELLEYLLSQGANPNAVDGLALTQTVLRGDVEVATILLQHGADPNLFYKDEWEKVSETERQKARELIASIQARLAKAE
jgi:hypothetical protein